MLFYVTVNLVCHSEFSAKIDDIENKMMSVISGFMREELTWNRENYTTRSFILYIPHVMLRKLKEGSLGAWGHVKCIQNYRPSHRKLSLQHDLVYFCATRIKV
jgi:hypothetical protein